MRFNANWTLQEGMLPALSVQSPWSWLLASGHKDTENRQWYTRYRGPLLIHAGRTEDPDFDWSLFARIGITDAPATFRHGGIVGIATLVDVVTSSDSPWFRGKYGFVLKDARSLEFVSVRGQLGLFGVPRELVQEVAQ